MKEGDKDTVENIGIGLLLWPFLHQTIIHYTCPNKWASIVGHSTNN